MLLLTFYFLQHSPSRSLSSWCFLTRYPSPVGREARQYLRHLLYQGAVFPSRLLLQAICPYPAFVFGVTHVSASLLGVFFVSTPVISRHLSHVPTSAGFLYCRLLVFASRVVQPFVVCGVIVERSTWLGELSKPVALDFERSLLVPVCQFSHQVHQRVTRGLHRRRIQLVLSVSRLVSVSSLFSLLLLPTTRRKCSA